MVSQHTPQSAANKASYYSRVTKLFPTVSSLSIQLDFFAFFFVSRQPLQTRPQVALTKNGPSQETHCFAEQHSGGGVSAWWCEISKDV